METGSPASFSVLACLMVGMAVPLILGRVKRNHWFGFRTAATLASDRIWYPANRAMGWALLWNGVILATLICAVFLRVPGVSLLLVLIYLPLSMSVMLAYGYFKLLRLK